MSMTGLVRRHPVAAFLVWFYPVAWAIAFIPMVARNTLGAELPMEPFIVAAVWLGGFLPVVAITRLLDGPDGLATLRQRITRVRVGFGWYALAFVILPAVALGLAVLSFGWPAVSASGWFTAVVTGFLWSTIVGCATTNLWEEATWMGFVQARLQSRYNVMLAAVITAVFFALQHVPLFVVEGLGFEIFLLFFVLTIPFRALIAWVYNRSGSLLVVGLVHAAGDALVAGSLNGVGLLPRLYDGSDVGFYTVLPNVVIGVVVIAATRGRLGLPRRTASGDISELAPAPVAA